MLSSDLLKSLIVGSYPLRILCNKEPPPTTSVCFGYIRGQNDFDKQWPQQNLKSCRTDDYEFSPAVYRDLSCCTEDGINSINGYYSMFDADSFSDSTSGGNCRAYNEMMELMICDPDQGSYVEQGNVSEEGENILRVCLSTCQKWFDACGLPGENLSEYFTYTDAQSMCEELWQGYGGDYCSPVYFQRSENFACKMKLSIQVVESSCLSMQEPSEDLIAYYEAMQNGGLIAEYPNDCNSEKKSPTETWILIGIIAGSVLGCCCLSGALFALTRFWCKRNSSSSSSSIDTAIVHPRSEDTFQQNPINLNGDDSDITPDESGGSRSLRDILPIPMPSPGDIQEDVVPVPLPVQSSSVDPPVVTRKIVDDVRVDDDVRVRASMPQPELLLTFLQHMDLRELEDQIAMGHIDDDDDYEERKNEILFGA